MSTVYSGTFTITAQPTITVTGPTGIFNVGDTVNISWTTTGSVGNVKIQLFKSTSSTATITNSTSNDGTYSWTIQSSQLNGTSSLYKIKIFETDGAPVDYGSYFTINEEVFKSVYDRTLFTEAVIKTTSTWKKVETPTDSIQFSDEDVYDDERIWKTIKGPTDSIQFSGEDVYDDERIWKIIRSPADSTSFYEAITTLAIRDRVPTDAVSFSEVVDRDRTHWKHFANQSDGVQFSDEDVDYTFNRLKNISDSTSFDEIVLGVSGKWKHPKSDSAAFSEQISNWIKSTFYIGNASSFDETVFGIQGRWKHLKNDSAAFIEVIDPEKRTWKHLKGQADSVQFSVDDLNWEKGSWQNSTPTDSIQSSEDVDDDKRTWKHLHPQSDSITFPTETVLDIERIWKHIKYQADSIAFTESSMDDWYITQWHRFYYDSTAFTEASMDDWYITQWHRFYEDSIQFSTDTVLHEIKTWKHIIADVIAFTENISDIFGEAPADSAEFIESVTSAIFKRCRIRKFDDNSAETFGGFRRSGWFSSSDADGNANIIRRLNVEYNSADPLDFKIYIDGDDTNHVFITTLPAATGVETTNKSVRVGKRAKNFMLEIASVESTNSNVKIEDIEVEIDGKV